MILAHESWSSAYKNAKIEMAFTLKNRTMLKLLNDIFGVENKCFCLFLKKWNLPSRSALVYALTHLFIVNHVINIYKTQTFVN